jgi:hypothetical protein
MYILLLLQQMAQRGKTGTLDATDRAAEAADDSQLHEM